MRSRLFRRNFAECEIAAVEVANMVGADTEVTGHRKAEFGRRWRGNLHSSIGKAERRAGQRSAPLPRKPKCADKDKGRRMCIRVVKGDVLHTYLASAAGGCQHVASRNYRRPLIVCEVVTAAELLIAAVVIGLDEELIFVFFARRADIVEVPPDSVRNGDLLQEILCDGADTAQRNLIAQERLLRDWVDQLGARTGEIAGSFGRCGDLLDDTGRCAGGASPLICAEIEELVL